LRGRKENQLFCCDRKKRSNLLKSGGGGEEKIEFPCGKEGKTLLGNGPGEGGEKGRRGVFVRLKSGLSIFVEKRKALTIYAEKEGRGLPCAS